MTWSTNALFRRTVISASSMAGSLLLCWLLSKPSYVWLKSPYDELDAGIAVLFYSYVMGAYLGPLAVALITRGQWNIWPLTVAFGQCLGVVIAFFVPGFVTMIFSTRAHIMFLPTFLYWGVTVGGAFTGAYIGSAISPPERFPGKFFAYVVPAAFFLTFLIQLPFGGSGDPDIDALYRAGGTTGDYEEQGDVRSALDVTQVRLTGAKDIDAAMKVLPKFKNLQIL